MKVDKNAFHDGKRQLSGVKNVATSKDFYLADVKLASKNLSVTINDFLTAALASSVKQYFEKVGDHQTSQVQIVIPANIRFQHYLTMEELKLENKFAVVPLTIPLNKDMQASLREIPKATQMIRSKFGQIYATYIATKFTMTLLPYFMTNWYMNFSTLAFTFAFSNVPGLLKPIKTFGRDHLSMTTYI
jgi:hypothetical protein